METRLGARLKQGRSYDRLPVTDKRPYRTDRLRRNSDVLPTTGGSPSSPRHSPVAGGGGGGARLKSVMAGSSQDLTRQPGQTLERSVSTKIPRLMNILQYKIKRSKSTDHDGR